MTFSDICGELGRPGVYLRGIQSRFELPVLDGDAYSAAYLAFLRVVVNLRILNIPEDTIRELWRIERKLLTLLHVDSTGSKTWFLDACGQTRHKKRRLLLSNYDTGVDLSAKRLQPELDFNERPPELFTAHEMGEDELRLLTDYLKLYGRVAQSVLEEIPRVRAAAQWARGVWAELPSDSGDKRSWPRSAGKLLNGA